MNLDLTSTGHREGGREGGREGANRQKERERHTLFLLFLLFIYSDKIKKTNEREREPCSNNNKDENGQEENKRTCIYVLDVSQRWQLWS